MALKRNTLVEVWWVDAYMLNDDEYTDEKPPAALTQSVGYVVLHDADALVIAMSRLADEVIDNPKITPADRHVYRDRMLIPVGCIKKVRRLKAP